MGGKSSASLRADQCHAFFVLQPPAPGSWLLAPGSWLLAPDS